MKNLIKTSIDKLNNGYCTFIRNHRGVALVEFAMVLPVLMLLTAGSFEVARYALIMQKLDRIVATLSDLVARSGDEVLTATEVSNILDSALFMAQPFDFSANSVLILTSVQGRALQPPEILSQRKHGSITGVTSAVGSTIGGNAILPTAFADAGSGETLSDGETLIIAEAIYEYSPYLTGNLGHFNDMQIYRDAYFRPRFTDTITFP